MFVWNSLHYWPCGGFVFCFCISVQFWCTQAVLFSSFGWHWRAISFRDVALLLKPFKCVSFSPPCLDHNLLSDITHSCSQLCSRSPLYSIYMYICYRSTWPFGPLWWQQGARFACLCLRHYVITRTGTFCGLWTSKMQSSHIQASSSSPQV